MIFLFKFLLKEGCVLLILQTNGGEVEAQRFLFCSPEREAVFVVCHVGKVLVYLLYCHAAPKWLAQGNTGQKRFLCQGRRRSHGLESKTSVCPSSLRPPHPPPSIFIPRWKKCKTALWAWPKQVIWAEVLVTHNAPCFKAGDRVRVWPNYP